MDVKCAMCGWEGKENELKKGHCPYCNSTYSLKYRENKVMPEMYYSGTSSWVRPHNDIVVSFGGSIL